MELTHATTAIMYFTAGRRRSGKQAEIARFQEGSMEYRIQKNLDRLTKKARRNYEW